MADHARGADVHPLLRGVAAFALATGLVSCAGPEGAYMGELDGLPRRDQAERARPRAVAYAAETPALLTSYVSPQGIEIAAPPSTYFEDSVEGRSLPYWVLGTGTETVLILGGKHGNERSSSELAYRFLEWAVGEPDALEGVRLVIAPEVNPDGLARGTRSNARDVDLNRNFPATNWASVDEHRGWEHRPGPHPRSEPETRFVLFLLDQYPASRVVSIHGAASCVNWDGPAEDLAVAMGRQCGLPPMASLGYPTPGSFGSYLGVDQQIPTITLELTHNEGLGKPFEAYRKALLTAVHYPRTAPRLATASLN